MYVVRNWPGEEISATIPSTWLENDCTLLEEGLEMESIQKR